MNRIKCEVCGAEFDPTDLTQVVYHANVPHVPVKAVQYAGALRIDTLPEWVRKALREPNAQNMRRIVAVAAEMAGVLPEALEGLRHFIRCERRCPCSEPEDCWGPDIVRAMNRWKGPEGNAGS